MGCPAVPLYFLSSSKVKTRDMGYLYDVILALFEKNKVNLLAPSMEAGEAGRLDPPELPPGVSDVEKANLRAEKVLMIASRELHSEWCSCEQVCVFMQAEWRVQYLEGCVKEWKRQNKQLRLVVEEQASRFCIRGAQ